MSLQSRRFRESQQLQDASQNRPALNRGARGEGVRLVQQALIELGHPLPISVQRHSTPDGIYGEETIGAVRVFQRAEKLGIDGLAGRQTMARLDQLLPNPGDPLPPLPGLDYTHRVQLQFYSIASPVVPEFQALRNAQRVYRQYGIDFSYSSGMSLALDPHSTIELNDVDTGTCRLNGGMTADQLRLFGLPGTLGGTSGNIRVFYVNTASSNGSGLRGCAAYQGTPSVVVAAAGSRWTLAHEVGHVLMGVVNGSSHSTDKANLMFGNTGSITSPLPSLTPAQVTAVKASPLCRAI